MNVVILKGNLTRDPEMRYTAKGVAVAGFSIAVNRTWKSEDGEKKEEVSFINCTAFGRTGEVIAEYFQQGSEILIEGRLKQDTWEDKQTEEKRTALKVLVEGFHFTSGSKTKEKSKNKESSKSKSKSKIDDADVPNRKQVNKGKKPKDKDDDDYPF